MKSALLVNMPFGSAFAPSIGLSLLQAALTRDGLPSEIRYFNQLFAERIGTEVYGRIAHGGNRALLGDWIFAASLFGNRIPPSERYFGEVLHARRGELLDDELDLDDARQDTRELLAVRDAVDPFLEACLAAVDWDTCALVGFTTLHFQTTASLALAKLLKERHPHLTIVFGGHHCEGAMGTALHRLFPFVDYVCSGEGDIAFPILAGRLLSGQPVGDIAGITRRVAGQTVTPELPGAPVPRLDALPVPQYDDFVQQWESTELPQDGQPYFLIETARGCWWGEKSHCTFCGLNGLSMPFRVKSAERAVDEFVGLAERYRPRSIKAVDNILDMRYFREVLPRLAELDLSAELFYETKANLTRDQVRLLHEAGVTSIQPGIESLSTNVLKLMRKGLTTLQNVQLLRWCAEFMVEPYWNFLAGFPGEDPRDYAEQATLVPLLTHLPPPQGLGLVRLDRFSPLFFEAEERGLCRLRPYRTYSYIYPFGAEDLFELAYFFDFDYADGRDPTTYVEPFRQEVQRWTDIAHVSRLVSLIDGQELLVYDTRPVALQGEYRLAGAQRAIYELCDRARTAPEIVTQLSASPWPLTDRETDRTLGELEAANLMLNLSGRYLSLAVSLDYQLAELAERYAQRLPLSPAMRRALSGLFDPRTPLLKQHFAARVFANSQFEESGIIQPLGQTRVAEVL